MDIRQTSGLTSQEATRRLKRDGLNELPSQRRQSILGLALNILKEPMLLLLLVSGFIYIMIGEPKDALMLMSFVLVVIGITFYQERKTERTLEALRNLSSPRALVIRDGQQQRIAGREVVYDDIIILREGDRIPADGVVLSCTNLSVDESLLSGESLPVRKSAWDGKSKPKPPGGDDLPFVYSGSLVVQGRGIARVIAAGVNTEMGKIGVSLEKIREEETLLHKETSVIVRNFAIVGLGLCLLLIAIYGFTRGSWLKGILSGLTLSMAILPEEFPVVLFIFLTLGAWRISKRYVLTRRSAAIETLGAATVLCVDKTGTLTLNKMELTRMSTQGKTADFSHSQLKKLSEPFHNLLEYAVLASQKDPFDPLEREIKKYGELYLSKTEHLHHNWSLRHEYPLSKELLALSHVWESPDKRNYVIAAKGAPEAIADLCHLNKRDRDRMMDNIAEMADSGLRVLAVAWASFAKADLPVNQHDFKFEYIGLLGFRDPVRATVSAAVKEAYRAGIRMIMITGDYPGTASFVASEIGLVNPDKYITGDTLARMSHLELRERIKSVNIFARVVPEQKLLIVNALKANGEIVAMTGDGVNDATALKSAHIGVAMGERGTDVAREASALVLLNDDFSSIVSAVRLGRRIFDNLKKAMVYILAIHVPIAGMSLLPVLFNLPVVLLPAHIAFLELIIDPACSTVFEAEPEDTDVMRRPPRSLREPLLARRTLIFAFMQGFSILALVFIIFLGTLLVGKGETEARTLSFTVLVLANLILILANLSWKQSVIKTFRTSNQALWWVLGGASVALLGVLYIPLLRTLFHFTVLHPDDLVFILVAGLLEILWFEGIKFIGQKI